MNQIPNTAGNEHPQGGKKGHDPHGSPRYKRMNKHHSTGIFNANDDGDFDGDKSYSGDHEEMYCCDPDQTD